MAQKKILGIKVNNTEYNFPKRFKCDGSVVTDPDLVSEIMSHLGSYVDHITKVGSPTISNHLYSNISHANYIKSTCNLNATLPFKFHTSLKVTDTPSAHFAILTDNGNNANEIGIIFGLHSTLSTGWLTTYPVYAGSNSALTYSFSYRNSDEPLLYNKFIDVTLIYNGSTSYTIKIINEYGRESITNLTMTTIYNQNLPVIIGINHYSTTASNLITPTQVTYDLKNTWLESNNNRVWNASSSYKVCTDTEFTQAVNTYGECDKFVLRSDGIRVPKLNNSYQICL